MIDGAARLRHRVARLVRPGVFSFAYFAFFLFFRLSPKDRAAIRRLVLRLVFGFFIFRGGLALPRFWRRRRLARRGPAHWPIGMTSIVEVSLFDNGKNEAETAAPLRPAPPKVACDC